MTTLDYAVWQLDKAPAWLSFGAGADWFTFWGDLKDEWARMAKEAIKARFPSLAAYDALEAQAADRATERYPTETEAAFRIRLGETFDRYQWLGTPSGVSDAVAAVPGVGAVGYFEAWQWDAGVDGEEWNWARFWVVLDVEWDEAAVFDEDDSETFDSTDTTLLFDLRAEQEWLAFLRRQVRRWKAAHAKCEAVLIAIGGALVFDANEDELWDGDELVFDEGDVVALEI